MSTQVTVTLPDNVYQRAQRLAELSGLNVENVIAEQLGLLPPLISEMDTRPIQTLSDVERAKLHMLTDIYGVGQMRKAQAMVEAVKRGLREAINP